MRRILSLLVLAFALAMPAAHAQQQTPEERFNELMLGGGGDPAWAGRAAFDIAPNAVAQLNGGLRAVGDVFAEIEVVPTRTARLTAAITLTSDEHGVLVIPVDTFLFARNQLLLGVGWGETQFLDGALEWCAVVDAQNYVCASRIDNESAEYRENGSQRRWRGPLLAMTADSPRADIRFARQFVIHAIDDEGIVIGRYVAIGATRVRAEGLLGPGPFDRGVMDRERMPDLPFRFRRHSSEQVVVELAR